jgi:predicted kinase
MLSSDVLRKRGRGIALSDAAANAAYTPKARAGVYRDLGERARAAVTGGYGIVVDATFGDPQLRAAFLEGFGDPQRLCAVECRAPSSLRTRRARERRPDSAHGSDADSAIAALLGASFSSWEELADDALLTLNCAVDAELLVDQLADWLDMRASMILPTAARLRTDGADVSPN